MSATELFRFRSVRAVNHQETTFNNLLVQPGDNVVYAKMAIPAGGIATALGSYSWIVAFSEDLAQQGDLLAVSAVIALLPSDWLTQAAKGSAAWNKLQTDLSNYLAFLVTNIKSQTPKTTTDVPVVPLNLIEPTEQIGRLLLIVDMISTLVAQNGLPTAQQTLQTPEDIRAALNFRSVTLQPLFFNNPQPVLARQPGVTDLYVVNTEWNRYIPDELSNVVNVLPGETFADTIRHLQSTTTATSTTTQQSTTTTNETDQTTSSSLSTAASSDASLNIGVQGQVQVSGQYGPTTVKTSLGAQLQSSQSSSQSTARTLAVETVARAVKTVTQAVTQIQTLSTTVRDSTEEKHSLQNTTSQVTVGLYRWLLLVNRSQIVSYPNRLVLEFEIPEPGAWLRWALENQPSTPYDNPDPGPFALDQSGANPSPLTADQIDSTSIDTLAGRWRIQGLTPPPPTTQVIGMAYNLVAPNSGTSPSNADNSMAVPTGYAADSFSAAIVTGRDVGVNDTHHTRVYVTVGGGTPVVADAGEPSQYANEMLATSVSGSVGDINTGSIPVALFGYYCGTVNAVVSVTCIQIGADNNGNGSLYQQWQKTTFDAIVDAYNTLLSAYNQEKDAREQDQGGPTIVESPTQNQERAVAELKRLVIEDLKGQTFTGYDLLNIDGTTGEPTMSPPTTAASSPVIQFFEQAFEWENIVYICYPYFWGGHERWTTDVAWSSADPVFDQFLNAGSARVVVPARPGFESLVNFYLYTGAIWGGKNPPAPNDPNYLSVASEIQSIQVGATDGTPVGSSWEVTLPTTLIWAGSDPTTLPTNPNPAIAAPTSGS